jgi:hypothetical protein
MYESLQCYAKRLCATEAVEYILTGPGITNDLKMKILAQNERASMKKRNKVFALPLLALAILALSAPAYADDSDKEKPVAYTLLKTVTLPTELLGFDISWVDSGSGRYYLANRGNAAATPPVLPSVTVIDTRQVKFLYSIPLSSQGNGVVAIRKSGEDDDEAGGELWVGANDSTVKVIDLAHPFAAPLSISTGGTARADELADDPADGIVLIANDRDATPFVTFISTKTHTVLGHLSYPQVVFGTPAVGHGLEQPVWNGNTKRFYLAVPATSSNPKGEVDEINPLTRMVTRVIPTTCNPAGLVLIPEQRLVTSCGDVIKIATGAVLTTVTKVGGDEIWFNPGDDRVYFGGGTDRISVPVVGTETNSLVTTITVGLIIPTPPAPSGSSHTTHSVAADSETNRIFVPVTHEGVKVYTAGGHDDNGSDN